MSGITSMTKAGGANSQERWAALDSQNERLVDATHPLLTALRRTAQDDERHQLPTAS
jgi:hypothetical protein